jgi:ComEC/Rec2-related protein
LDEYKRIAKLALVPSFFAVLPVFAAIILTYSLLTGPNSNLAIGILCFSISLLIIIFYTKYFTRYRSTLYFIILLSLIIVIRIILLFRFAPVDENSKKFSASIGSVKALRYSNEIVLDFFESDTGRSRHSPVSNKAVSYIEKEIKINSGDELEIYARPKEIKINGREISSFEADLLKKGFHFIFYLNAKNFGIIKNAPVTLKDKIRNIIEDNLVRLFNKKTIPVIKGLYFANSSYIDKSTTMDFKRAGVLHILAASGEHIGIIAGILLLVLSPFLIHRKILRILIALVLLFYLYITDMPVSLLRAFVMYFVFSVQEIFNLEKNIFNTLFLSAIIILAIYPYELYSLGFQLSFGATFGILLFYNFYKDIFFHLPSKISSALAVTFSAQIFVIPVLFFVLNELNLAGFLSNVVIVFTMSGTMLLSIAANLISVIAFEPAHFFAMLTDYLYLASLKIVQYFSGLNGHFAVDNGKGLLLFVPFILFLLPVVPVKINRKMLSLAMIISVPCAWIILSGNYSEGKDKITIFGKEANIIVLQEENSAPIIFGYLNTYIDADNIAGYVNRYNIRNINVCIPVPDYNNLRNYTLFIKKAVVSKCYISSDFMFAGYFKKFCQALDADGIALKIKGFNLNTIDQLTADNIPGYLKNILAAPLENIAEIHKLLTENYGSKTAVIEEINKYGYKIEYLE